jgi:hypothetical protein
MRRCVLGVSVSVWEGFNLPLGEMQLLGKTVLALDVAAHPEVAMVRWCLAQDVPDLAAKACVVLEGLTRAHEPGPGVREAWEAHFTWKRFQREFAQFLDVPVAEAVAVR